MKKLLLPLGLLALTLMACYSPEPFEAEYSDESSNTDTSAEMGKIYSLNGGKQTCNPSASQDTVNYPASMLWLNFSGTLNVNAPDSGFTLKKVLQHDRLTVSDTANNVKWYLMRDTSAGECQFQDPEWSTHPNFIVALRGYDVDGSKACENLDYGIFAVRMSDKKKFWFDKKGIPEEATPHLWVGEPDDGFKEYGDSLTVEGFFGSDKVILTYVDKNQNIVVARYGTLEKGKPQTFKLKKPSNRKNWKIDSPLISPNGWYVVYNMYENSTTWEAYLQYINEDSEPFKIERTKDMMSEPAQPHWYKIEYNLFVVWSEFPAGSQMLNKNDLTKTSVQNGSVGRTVMRGMRSFPKTNDESVGWDGNGVEIAPVPMTGGITPDGKFLATGTNPAYLLKLP
ncbi:MAG: hypothetical protein J6W51_08320 [Fibrobacter sp.]|nr:hypothetical protein [Fibrobacter sp.]